MSRVLSFRRRRRTKRSGSCSSKLPPSKTSSPNTPDDSVRAQLNEAANVLQRIALENPAALVMMISLGRKIIALSE